MHEYPVTREIVGIASKQNKKIKTINIVAGENCGYLPDSICLFFDEISVGTPCEGAMLNFEFVEAKLRCVSCGKLFRREPFLFDCPTCGGEGRPTDIGREFYIKSVEV